MSIVWFSTMISASISKPRWSAGQRNANNDWRRQNPTRNSFVEEWSKLRPPEDALTLYGEWPGAEMADALGGFANPGMKAEA